MQTRSEFLEEAKVELGEIEFKSLYHSLDNEYYESIEKQVKDGKVITKEVFDSLSEGQKFHFTKHYNFRGDKIQN